MADGNALFLHMGHLMAKDLIHQSHAPCYIHPGSVRQGDAGAFLPTVLQCVEAEVCHVGHILRMGIHAKDAAFLVPA